MLCVEPRMHVLKEVSPWCRAFGDWYVEGLLMWTKRGYYFGQNMPYFFTKGGDNVDDRQAHQGVPGTTPRSREILQGGFTIRAKDEGS